MARKRTDWLHLGSGKSYVHRVHRPLQCLVFITPLLLFYQIASALHPWTPATAGYSPHVVAFVLMLDFFALFGAAGNVLPLMAVVAILIFWHLARKDPWDFEPKLYGGMALESVIWGVPFVVIGLAVTRHVLAPAFAALLADAAPRALTFPWQTDVMLSVGAGVYEELLFRLIAITLLSIFLVDILELKPTVAVPIIVITSAALFSAYHYLGEEGKHPFQPGLFAFRTALGIYLAGIYIYRGFGITVGAHTVYDLIIVGLSHAHAS